MIMIHCIHVITSQVSFVAPFLLPHRDKKKKEKGRVAKINTLLNKMETYGLIRKCASQSPNP